jgi:hypothetical protein
MHGSSISMSFSMSCVIVKRGAIVIAPWQQVEIRCSKLL